MKRVLLLSLTLLLAFTGVAFASSINGDYKGNPIVKLFSSGKEIVAKDVPAQLLNGRTMVPIYMLDELGIKVTWDQKSYSVNVELPKTEQTGSSQLSLIKSIQKHGGYDIRYFNSYRGLEVTVTFFEGSSDEYKNWPKILEIIKLLSAGEADVFIIDYQRSNGKATISANKTDVQKFVDGHINEDQLFNTLFIDGGIFSKPLDKEQVEQLTKRVGLVIAKDSRGQPFSQGSGFMLSNSLFVTNYHVVDGSASMDIYINSKIVNNNKYYFADKEIDIFGVYLEGSHPYLEYDVNLPQKGDKVYAIGSPGGKFNTITEGTVYGIHEENGIQAIFHTADTEPGSSGGVLINEKGKVIGITSRGYTGTQAEYAIPIKYVIEKIK